MVPEQRPRVSLVRFLHYYSDFGFGAQFSDFRVIHIAVTLMNLFSLLGFLVLGVRLGLRVWGLYRGSGAVALMGMRLRCRFRF